MAKMIVKATPSIPSVLSGLTRFAGVVRSTRPALEEAVDEIIIPAIDEAFETESDPVTGESWEPLSDVMPHRVAMGAENNPILQVSGELRRHATMKKYWQTQGQQSVISMMGPLDPPYWALQQFGGPNMGLHGGMGSVPERPYLGISEQQVDQIGEKLQEYAVLRGLL